jgi:hypothetical protein
MSLFETMRSLLWLCFACTALADLTSCSIFIEANRPAYKDTSLLQQGVSRAKVVGELGEPAYSYSNEGKTVDLYLLDPEGRRLLTKIGLTTFNLAADFFSAGLWEAVGTPLESKTRHRLTPYIITYSANLEVESVITAIPPDGPILALTVERRVQVAGVDAVYLSVINLSPDPLALASPIAVSKSGETVPELAPDDAIKLAGGPENIRTALDHLPNGASTAAQSATRFAAGFIPGTQANADSGMGLTAPFLLLDPAAPLVTIMMAITAPAMVAANPLTHEIRQSLLSDPNPDLGTVLQVGKSRQGYAFFPAKAYSAVEITGHSSKSIIQYSKTVTCKLN